jgi:hypothetical protein
MGRACSTNEDRSNGQRVLVEELEGKRILGRLRLRWLDNIKIDLRATEWDGMDWSDLAQNRDQ